MLPEGTNIPHTETTCAFWAKGGCVKPANKCRYVHVQTRYLASHARYPTRLRPGDIVDGARQDSRPGSAVGPRDAISTNQTQQDAAAKRKQEQDAADPTIPTKKRELTCWYWLSEAPCRYSDRECLWSHTEHEYVAPRFKGGPPLPYEHALEQMYGGSSSNIRSRLPMLNGAGEYDDEPISMPQASSSPRGARARQDTVRDNINRTMLPDLSVRQGAQTLAGNNPKVSKVVSSLMSHDTFDESVSVSDLTLDFSSETYKQSSQFFPMISCFI